MKFEKKFEFFDVTADVGFRAHGKTIDEAFQNAALAMFEVITDTSIIKAAILKEIEVESEDPVALLYDWLSELLFIHDSENMIFSDFEVTITQKTHELYSLKAKAWGETFNFDKHESKDDVKAVTFHLMKVKKNKEYHVQVILDT
ncbi:MAG: archease [Methanobacterium sp.]|nr:archease [Methanobacterium sp.]